MDDLKDKLESQEEKDFKKLFRKYFHEFMDKYFDKFFNAIIIKDLGIIFVINPTEVKHHDRQSEILNNFILDFAYFDGYYEHIGDTVVITDKGKEYIKNEGES